MQFRWLRERGNAAGLMAAVLLALSLLQGCTASRLLIVNTLARSGDYNVQRDIAYGDDPRQKIDIYRPQPLATTTAPALIFVPGGCWGACTTFPKDDYRFVAEAFTAQGYSVVTLDYRLYPQHRFGDIIADVRAAVEWVASHGAAHGVNADALVLMGHSAGAHMAALLALDERYLQAATRARLKGVVGLAGPYDFLPFSEPYQPGLFGPEVNYPASQPINFVSGHEPPLLLLYGTADQEVKPRNIVSLTRRVQEQGGIVQARCYDGISHGGIVGALSRPMRNSTPVYADILAFLEQIQAGTLQRDSRPLVCAAAG